MRGVLLAAALLLLSAQPLVADEPLPSRSLTLPPLVITGLAPQSFDLIDFRAEESVLLVPPVREVAPKSIFGLKRHLGVGGGYDNGVVHASVGFYFTVAEWGRWNFGVPSPAVGFGRYRVYDAKRKEGVLKEESTIFVSLASVHFRGGYLRTFGVNWYVNLEQVFDMRRSMSGSQIGISFSRK
jgi:hypothetical protein